MAVKKDVTGYYAARMLCDVLPASSLYDDMTSAAAAKEIVEARHLDQGKSLDPPRGKKLTCRDFPYLCPGFELRRKTRRPERTQLHP